MKIDVLKTATKIAYLAHKGQFRKYGHSNDCYILHPMRVMGLVLMADPDHATEDVLAAAILHDVMEDSAMTAKDMLEAGIPQGTVDIVAQLTRKKDKRLRSVRFNEMLNGIKYASRKVKIIKLADRADNLGDIVGDKETPFDFATTYAREGLLLAEALRGTNVFLEARIVLLAARIEHDIVNRIKVNRIKM